MILLSFRPEAIIATYRQGSHGDNGGIFEYGSGKSPVSRNSRELSNVLPLVAIPLLILGQEAMPHSKLGVI